MFNSWGLVNAYGTYQSYYKQHLLPGHSMALLNLVGSTQSSFVLLFSIVVGRFLDAGHFYRLTCTGAVLVTLGSFLLSLEAVTDYFVFVWLTQGMVMSLGMACMFVPSSQSECPRLTAISLPALTPLQSSRHGSQNGRPCSWASSPAVQA